MWLGLLILSVAGRLGFVRATLPNVDVEIWCESQYEWMYNSRGEPPCRVYAYISSHPMCLSPDDVWTVEPLDDDDKTYPPPTGDTANGCQCNEPAYALIQACTVCQGYQSTTSWTDWTAACGGKTYVGFPYGLDGDIQVPGWAGLDVIKANKWDEAAARNYVVENGSSAMSTSSGSQKKDHKKTIAIIAGSCAGVACLLVVVGVFWWLSVRNDRRRRQQQQQNPWNFVSTDDGTPKGDDDKAAVTPPILSNSPPNPQTTMPFVANALTGTSGQSASPPQSNSELPAPRRPAGYPRPPGPKRKKKTDDDSYVPSSTYEADDDAMQGWLNGARGNTNTDSRYPATMPRPGSGTYGADSDGMMVIGADPPMAASPYQTWPGPRNPQADPVTTSNQRGNAWRGPNPRFVVNNAAANTQSGNPDGVTESPSPAIVSSSADAVSQQLPPYPQRRQQRPLNRGLGVTLETDSEDR